MGARFRIDLLVATLCFAGCGSGGPPAGPFDQVPLTEDLDFAGLEGPVHVVRDQFGIAHISADSIADLAFAEGYVMAHDRLPQMDILRRMGAGTLSELFGGLDDDVVESDLEMRIHRMKPIAAEAYAELQASTDPIDQDLVQLLDRFADGVNAYRDDLVAGKYQIDSAILVIFDPERFEPWSPVDSLVLGRFQSYSLSFTGDEEIEFTDVYQQAVAVFDQAAGPGDGDYDPARYARRGASRDLARLVPTGRVPTMDGYPTSSRRAGAGRDRPWVPRDLLANARAFFRAGPKLGPRAFTSSQAGSNNWAVGPSLAGGAALLAGDQHLSLPNPSLFYPVQLIVPGKLDVVGVTFPGIPAVILGHNGHAAWAATVNYHDVNDVYLEQIVPCSGGGGDCVVFDGGQVPIETWQEEIRIGVLGTILDTKTVTYERVPHHGPIIPTIAGRDLVPRTGDQALSLRYTGHQLTHELRAVYRLARSAGVGEAVDALTDFEYGGQNWVIIDGDGNIGWSTHVLLPVLSPDAYAWDPVDDPTGMAPFMVLPGDGSAEWQGFLDAEDLPHAVNPNSGYLVTANSDPVGATFDGDPLDGPMVDGRPLYYGALYAPGLRSERIAASIQQRVDAQQAITRQDMAAIQADADSTIASHMQPGLAAIVATLSATPQADVTEWLATLPSGRAERLAEAGARLTAWSLATPPAVESDAGEAERADSVATTLFNVWLHYFYAGALGDEYQALGWDVYDVDQGTTVRTAVALLEEPDSLATGLATETGQPLLCDDMATADAVESCDLVALKALDSALAWLAGADGFDTTDMDQYLWGSLHTLTLEPLFPEHTLDLPPPDDPDPALRGGYPRAGDDFGINRADCGHDDLDFAQGGFGPAQRYLAETTASGGVTAWMALPGGTVYHRDSPHYRDLMDDYYIPGGHFAVPFTTEEIVDAGEERWLFRDR